MDPSLKKQTKSFLEEVALLAPKFYALTRVNGAYAMVTLDLSSEALIVSEEDIFSISSSKVTKNLRKDLGL